MQRTLERELKRPETSYREAFGFSPVACRSPSNGLFWRGDKIVSVCFCVGTSCLEGTLLVMVMTILVNCKRVGSWYCVGGSRIFSADKRTHSCRCWEWKQGSVSVVVGTGSLVRETTCCVLHWLALSCLLFANESIMIRGYLNVPS